MPLRYNVNGDYAVFSRMKEKGISLAAFATTVLFLILTVVMVSVTLQSAYAWLVMGSTLFLFITLCSYSSCEKTHGSQWRRASINSDTISTISEGRDITVTDYNRSILPYWITDLPPSYAVATSGSTNCADTTEGMNAYPPPPPYSSVVQIPIINNLSTEQQQTVNAANIHNLSLPPLYTPRMPVQEIGPPVRVHSLRIKSNSARKSDCDTRSLDGRLSDRGHSNCAFSDNNSTC